MNVIYSCKCHTDDTAEARTRKGMSITIKKDNFLSNLKEQASLFDDAESGSTECRLRDKPLRW